MLCSLSIGQMWADMYLAGSMNDWAQTDATKFVDNKIEVTLAAETTYEFKIVDSGTWRSFDGSFSNTSLNYVLDKENVEGYNISITTGEAGTYIFQYSWYDSKHHLSVYYPQARLKKNTVLYFDGRNSTKGWGTYTWGARFFYKYYDSGVDHSSLDCTSAVEGYVHYTTVPNHDYLGQIQVERKDPSNMDGGRWNYTGVCCAYNRANSAQNCMAIADANKDWDDTFIPEWTTYCPPMSSVTLADNGTTNWGGNGSSSTPYLVPTGGDIKVHVTASASALDDANMTKYFLFKKAGSAIDSGSSSTDKTITASGTTGTKEAVIVEAYNYYNSTEGTHLASSAIYYEARTPYTISYNAGTGGSGSRASETKLKGVNFTLPNSAVFERTGYTQTGWTTSNLGAQTHAFGASYSSDAAQTFYPAWTPKSYTINLANMEATTAGTESVTVTFDASTHMTASDPITKPTKTHYDFAGYWTSENTGATLDHQLIAADGKWIKDVEGYTSHDGLGNPTWVHDYPISLYAKWTEHEYAITMAVSPSGAGTTSPASTATGKLVTESGNITATPAAGYKFKEWQFSKTGEAYDVWCADGYSSTDATIHIKAQHNGTLTAVFEERYSLVGSLYDGSEGGMPGWEDYSKTFTVNSSSPVDLTRTCTLQAGKTYKVQVHDLATSTNLGRSGCDPVCVLEENASLVMENSNNDVFLYTSGAGEYIFKITAVDGSGHPTLTVLRPYPVNFGQKYQDIDGTLHDGTTGGTAAATAGSALSSGDYVTYNTSVTHTATPASGYTFAGWWSSDAFEGNAFSNTNPMTYAVTSGDNTYAKFEETSTSVTLSNDGHGKVQIGGVDKTSTTCGVTTTRELTAVPNDGYYFTGWTKTSGTDYNISSTSANPTTLSGRGSGASSGQTLTANFALRYSIKGTMNSENWGTDHFISNFETVGGKVIGYVEMTLSANTSYEFAIYDLANSEWLKSGSNQVYYMTNGNSYVWDFATNKSYNCGITTAGAGTYRFLWNITDKTMSVIYPNFIIYRSGDKAEDPRATGDDVESYGGGTISQAIEFRMKVRDLDMWYSLCLPFTVSAVKVWDEDDGAYYGIEPYYREQVGDPIHGGHYIIRTPRQTTDLPIAEFGDWRDPISPTGYVPTKDAPYIIQWHNSYFLNKYVSFFGATGQTIPTSFSAGTAPSSNDVINVCTNNSMTTGSLAGAYMLESDYGNGAWLRLDNADELRPIPPFECYLLVNNPTRARYMAIRPGMTAADTPTGWDDVVNSEIKTHIIVYSISGVCLTQYSDCSINEAGQRLSESYGEGLYILRADNESVKLMVGGK